MRRAAAAVVLASVGDEQASVSVLASVLTSYLAISGAQSTQYKGKRQRQAARWRGAQRASPVSLLTAQQIDLSRNFWVLTDWAALIDGWGPHRRWASPTRVRDPYPRMPRSPSPSTLPPLNGALRAPLPFQNPGCATPQNPWTALDV